MSDYDVIIIGSGAGGGSLAYKLAPSGLRVLLIERGDVEQVIKKAEEAAATTAKRGVFLAENADVATISGLRAGSTKSPRTFRRPSTRQRAHRKPHSHAAELSLKPSSARSAAVASSLPWPLRRGCTSGTPTPRGWAKRTFDRGSNVPRHRSASGRMTLKFLCM